MSLFNHLLLFCPRCHYCAHHSVLILYWSYRRDAANTQKRKIHQMKIMLLYIISQSYKHITYFIFCILILKYSLAASNNLLHFTFLMIKPKVLCIRRSVHCNKCLIQSYHFCENFPQSFSNCIISVKIKLMITQCDAATQLSHFYIFL